MRYLVIGGTGTLGKAVIAKLYKKNENADITIYSRDELKQKQVQALYPKLNCIIGDVRDSSALIVASANMDAIFHFAALKHIEIAEANPEECIKTNVLGTINVARCATVNGVSDVVFSSTDKAVLPINTYGFSKAISEKYLLDLNSKSNTHFSVFRWGNVLGSRGSVIHSFVETLKKEKKLYITDPKMTRFWIDIDDAAEFILSEYRHAERIMIPNMKAARVVKLAEMTARYLGITDYTMHYTGIRPGEKYHEVLWSDHDHCIRSDTIEDYSDEELLDLIDRTMKR